MSDALTDVQTALISHLREQASLSPWLGSPARVYDEVPEATAFPCVTLGRLQSQSIGGVNVTGGDLIEQGLTLMVVSRFGGSEEVKGIVAELRVIIDAAELSLTDHVLVSLWVSFVDIFRSNDQRTIYGVVRVRAVTEPV